MKQSVPFRHHEPQVGQDEQYVDGQVVVGQVLVREAVVALNAIFDKMTVMVIAPDNNEKKTMQITISHFLLIVIPF